MKAWKGLYDLYYAALCSYTDGIVKDRDATQDIVQDTLIKIWKSDRIFPDMKDMTWYLYCSAYNNALFYLRTQNNRLHILQRLSSEEPEMPEDQFNQTVQEELIRQLYIYIEELPKERKKVLLLTIQGHSGTEISGLNICIFRWEYYYRLHILCQPPNPLFYCFSPFIGKIFFCFFKRNK